MGNIEYFDAFSISVVPREYNDRADSLAISATLLIPHLDFGQDKYIIELIYKPSVPDN